MRIIAGKYGGRVIETSVGKRTHPMGDRVRGGLFNALGDIDGLSLLDAFAGSGALSLEAVSRDAGPVVAIDIDKKAYEVVIKNIRQLGLEGDIKAIRANASSWSDKNPEKLFDIVIAAPPYDDLQLKLVEKLTCHLKPAGIYVLDWPGKMDAPQLEGLKIVAQKNYGDAQLVFYRRSGA